MQNSNQKKMATSNAKPVVVWEWETNYNGVFAPYHESASNLIEKAYTSSQLYVNLSELGTAFTAWSVDLVAMRQKSSYFGRERVIRRNLYPGDSLIAFGIVWEYHDDLDWQQFDVRSSSILEDSGSIGDTNIDLQQGNGFNINVNLTSMMMRDSLTNRSSQIRRRKLNVPYTCVSINPQTKLRVSNSHQIKDKYHDENPTQINRTTSNDKKIIVWEFETDKLGIFAPYPECHSNLIETEYSSGKNSVSLNLSSYIKVKIDFSTLKEMQYPFAKHRRVRRTLYTKDIPLGNQISWEWMDDLDWEAYQVETAVVIEDHFKKGSHELKLNQTPLRIPNTLNFRTMTQRNDIFGTSRKVRRRTMSIAYTLEKKSGKKDSASASAISKENGKLYIQQKKRRVFLRSIQQNLESVSEACMDRKENNEGTESKIECGEEINEDTTVVQICRLQNVPIRNLTLKRFCKSCHAVAEDDECSICLSVLKNPSETYGESVNSVVELSQCHHIFHECCLEQYYESGNKDGSLQCPVCKCIHGIRTGTQPPGTMTVQYIPGSVPGENCQRAIQITYNIRSGIQGPEHPNPGQPYHPIGFPRTAYLPDSDKGRKVLGLLQEAWKRRLIFTVGTSVTSGTQNAVVWNEIHHKTEVFSNHSGHGYPDPNYLDNVLAELKIHGVE